MGVLAGVPLALAGLLMFGCSSSSSNDTGAGTGGVAGSGATGGAAGAGERSIACEVGGGVCTGNTDCCFVSGGNPDSCLGPTEECLSRLSDPVRFACDDTADCKDMPDSICCFSSPLATCRFPAACAALGGLQLCDPSANDCADKSCTATAVAGAPYLACE